MDRTAFADEAGPELVKHPINLTENLPKPLRINRVVRTMHAILAEADRLRGVVRHVKNVNVDAEFRQGSPYIGVKFGDRPGRQRDPFGRAVVSGSPKHMGRKIKCELKRAVAIWNDRCGQTPWRYIERDVP